MTDPGETRIQLCGRLVVRLEGQRLENSLPGVLGQLLVAYLVLNRLRRINRDELLIAVYGEGAASDHQARLSVLLSKLRRVVGTELLIGRAQIELVLPAHAFVDVEATLDQVLHDLQQVHLVEDVTAQAFLVLENLLNGGPGLLRGLHPESQASGRQPGVPPALRTTSPVVPCWAARIVPGSTSGGGASRKPG